MTYVIRDNSLHAACIQMSLIMAGRLPSYWEMQIAWRYFYLLHSVVIDASVDSLVLFCLALTERSIINKVYLGD